MKKTYPELANAIRELATYMDSPGEEHWKWIGRTVGFLIWNAINGLTFKVPKNLLIEGYVDSDYVTNKETRRSTTGYLITVRGCLISWQSKAQPSMTLSSTEAEYVAASTCASEIKFILMLMEELIGDTETPILHEDNTRAIFLMHNDQVRQRTKHISVKWHHIIEMIQEGELTTEYIRSEENACDIMTKNTKESIFLNHSRRIKYGEICPWNREDVVK